jgi:ABC-type transporter Mla subunit MlaD
VLLRAASNSRPVQPKTRIAGYRVFSMLERPAALPRKASRLVTAALNLDDTLAHVDRSLSDFDDVLAEFRSLLVEFATVLDRFGETVERVDGTVDKVGEINAQMSEVVDELGGIAQTFSPALAVNDELRRQLDRLRSLAGGGAGDTTRER